MEAAAAGEGEDGGGDGGTGGFDRGLGGFEVVGVEDNEGTAGVSVVEARSDW